MLSIVLMLNIVTTASSTAASAQPENNGSFHGGITNDARTFANKTFDYVVCGGGLTGLTVASRLSENPNVSVLVIENGYADHTHPHVQDVRNFGQAFGTELDHNITTTPNPWQNGKELPLVAGKTLGGSGSLNGASWTKGPSSQYDLLPLLTGDDSWAWKPFNEYMMKAEHFNPPDSNAIAKGAQYEGSSHGKDGPVQVSFGAGMFGEPQVSALEASKRVWPGLQRNRDATVGDPNGATIIPDMVEPDESQNRSSPLTAYVLDQVKQRDNFHILTGHRVTEIVWKDGQSMVADGVHFQACRTRPVEFVRASREVLLAAGALQSPQVSLSFLQTRICTTAKRPLITCRTSDPRAIRCWRSEHSRGGGCATASGRIRCGKAPAGSD